MVGGGGGGPRPSLLGPRGGANADQLATQPKPAGICHWAQESGVKMARKPSFLVSAETVGWDGGKEGGVNPRRPRREAPASASRLGRRPG